MSESFEQLFKQSLEKTKMRVGDTVNGTVVGIDDKYVLVNVGLKSEGAVSIEQFTSPVGDLTVNVGDEVEVVVEAVADDFGETRLSREKAKRAETWRHLIALHDSGELVTGVVTGKVKGGFTVEIDSVRAFLPGSLVDLRPVADTSWLEGNEFEFKIIKVDEKRNNIVVSRRAVIEETSSAERSKLLETLQEGQIIKGAVKNLTDYGAFIDLGGIDGLLHITDIAWRRVKVPSEVLKIGDEVEVVVLRFDRDRGRVSLGMKQLNPDPWTEIKKRYPVKTQLRGKVTNLTDYGCFVEIEDGVEGLVHVSEMDWTNKNIDPSKIVHAGDEVDVIVLGIDEDRRRISLGMKQCSKNPWEVFEESHKAGDRIKGKIRSITDFGIFVGLEGNIDGLIHVSDISWDEGGEKTIRDYQKEQEIEAVILSIDSDRERISLGIKQMQSDPFSNYVAEYPKGKIVKGKVTEVEEKFALVELADKVIGRIKASEISAKKVMDAREKLKIDDEIEARIINVNQKTRSISLSIKSKDEPFDAESTGKKASGQKDTSGKIAATTLGDLLKEKMGGSVEKQETKKKKEKKEKEKEPEQTTEKSEETESEIETETESEASQETHTEVETEEVETEKESDAE